MARYLYKGKKKSLLLFHSPFRSRKDKLDGRVKICKDKVEAPLKTVVSTIKCCGQRRCSVTRGVERNPLLDETNQFRVMRKVLTESRGK